VQTPPFTTIRTIVLFTAGLAGIAYETLVENAEKPTLIVLFAAMIGLPAFLNKDEKDRAQAKESLTPPPPPPPPPAEPLPPATATSGKVTS
jgi:hypothetical protein